MSTEKDLRIEVIQARSKEFSNLSSNKTRCFENSKYILRIVLKLNVKVILRFSALYLKDLHTFIGCFLTC